MRKTVLISLMLWLIILGSGYYCYQSRKGTKITVKDTGRRRGSNILKNKRYKPPGQMSRL